mgnify:CR=1 FL=1
MTPPLYRLAVALAVHGVLALDRVTARDAVRLRAALREAFRFDGAEVTIAAGRALVAERWTGRAWRRATK